MQLQFAELSPEKNGAELLCPYLDLTVATGDRRDVQVLTPWGRRRRRRCREEHKQTHQSQLGPTVQVRA
jgi:hypothetical protein